MTLKNHLKCLAERIRFLKDQRTSKMHGRIDGLAEAAFNYRVHHIAASILRGKTLDQIEPNRRADSPEVQSLVECILREVSHDV